MGRKGVSKRKPKRSKSSSNNNVKGSSNMRPGASPSMQDIVKDKDAAFNKGNTNSYTGSNKKK